MACPFFGAPGGTRTPDLLVRSQSLYPAELRAHAISNSLFILPRPPPKVNSFFLSFVNILQPRALACLQAGPGAALPCVGDATPLCGRGSPHPGSW